MNKKIKFRVWDKPNKTWVKNQHWFISQDGRMGILEGSEYIFPPDSYLDYFTIQEFSDYSDKNGKEIYEGDIISYKDCALPIACSSPYEYKKEYIERKREVKLNSLGWGLWGMGMPPSFLDKIEVIGNIYENPELLTN
jgi:uncharacterized phage protein (TIGR01671 family)